MTITAPISIIPALSNPLNEPASLMGSGTPPRNARDKTLLFADRNMAKARWYVKKKSAHHVVVQRMC